MPGLAHFDLGARHRFAGGIHDFDRHVPFAVLLDVALDARIKARIVP